MKIDKTTFKFLLFVITSTFILTIVFYFFLECGSIWQLFYDLSLGIFCSAMVALFVVYVSARSKFLIYLNKILFICKSTYFNFNKIYYIENNRFLIISDALMKNFEDFYQIYLDIDFIRSINLVYKKPIVDLFVAIGALVSPFSSLLFQNDIKRISEQDIISLRQEILVNKERFYKFVYAYVDLYSLYDKVLLNSIIELDSNYPILFESNDNGIKHETIAQIIGKRPKR